ncbi:MAG: 3'(2'),5'-bisphosphate nucleotidase CysQ [Flavobacteriales bacterium]|nr:3'(2'),5'-bisphosphate nucleotidase CysQ [Flavobacteriales bacterium]
MDLNLIAINAAIDAGKEILKVYASDFEVETKDDDSPLTVADKNAHSAIMAYLNKTQIPVLSEEGAQIDYEQRKDWNKLWIVDPLDGTKEFIKKNGEFTVNIALIENQVPVFGVIYVPVKKELYFGGSEIGSFMLEGMDAKIEDLNELMSDERRLPMKSDQRPYTVVASRSHLSAETETFIKEQRLKHPDLQMASMGSSLKICLVASGKADVYPRFAPTMEWDVAAGHAIVLGAGKEIIDWETKERMVYNRPNLLNNWFLVR